MKTTFIHDSAIIEPTVELGEGVSVGPYSVIRGPSRIGDGTLIMERVSIGPGVEMGRENRIHMGAIIGHEPQDRAYKGQITKTRIGDKNEIREYVTIHRGTKDDSETVIGNENLLMAQCHVAHNCRIGNLVIMANGALLAGYVTVDDQAFLSGGVLVHQFVRIGRLALLRGGARTSRDVPPFCIIDGTHTVRTLNRIGLRRAGYSAQEIDGLRKAFRDIFKKRSLDRSFLETLTGSDHSIVREMASFILSSKRGICQSSGFIDKSSQDDYD